MKRRSLCISVLALAALSGSVLGSSPSPGDDVIDTIRSRALFFEHFNDGDAWESRWKHSSHAKYDGRFTVATAKDWTDPGLRIPEKSKHYGLTALLSAPVEPLVGGEQQLPLIVQYEVKYSEGTTCGGAYLKLLSSEPGMAPEDLVDSTPYSVMFGPDRCGGPGKVHLILRHRNAKNGSVSEKHLTAPPVPETNDYTHVYTLRINPDHKYEILIDGAVKSQGDLLLSLEPPLLPPGEVPDPTDTKPADWVDQALIPDPTATKPSDWDDRERVEDMSASKPKGWLDDEPALIPDAAATKPEDWDNEEDGEWEPPSISNPKCKVGCGPWKRPTKPNPAYKGPWKAPMVDNPAYKGPWVQRQVPNPDFYEDDAPLQNGVAAVGAVALELWTVDQGYMFDNVLITRDPGAAEEARERLWKPRHAAEVAAFEAATKAAEEAEKERKKAEAAEKKNKDKTKAKRRRSRAGDEPLEQLADALLAPFKPGAPLAPLRPYLAPALDWLDANPQGSAMVVGVVPLLLLALLMLARSGRGRGQDEEDAAARAKKTDTTGPDDDEHVANAADVAAAAAEEPVGEEAEGEQEGVKEDADGGAGGADGDKAESKAQEIVADDDEEEEEEQAAGARRRTRRAA